uniref:Reverse transcriptase domain-containing protein n=1 Tax=Panagrolaimus superbus TaxID=310955 RepID=A0A914Z2F8_9BILA
MCNVAFSVQLDSGSDISIITRDDYQKLGAPTLSPPQIKVKAVGNMKLELDGYFVADVTARGTTKSLEIYVADVASALLGLDFWHSFDLQIADELLCQNVSDVPIEAAAPFVKQLHTKFAPLFREGLGCCTKKEITLQLKPNAKRVVIPARRLSILASAVTKKELDRLLDLKIIRPYIGPVEYATPGSTVKKKDGGDRFVVDFSTGLNDQLEESSYQLPVPEEIFAKLVGAKYFSRLDMKDGYYQLKVSEESKRFLIISTPFGYFQYERAAMGLKPLPGDFQQIMDEMLAGLSCAAAYLDDVFIFSETEAEHRRHIEEVLARIMQWGFLLNLKKCIFFLKSVRFLGRVIDAHGIRPDPEKIAAVQSMPDPTNVSTLRSFLAR